ncbi:MAG: hypothetical protein ACP5I6_07425 [Caldisphaera sp.]|jgi:hypothetical protein|nr:hypothetical protein [Caldisphaera sp.]PMP91809.1 MAG: hypothetical protein C0171_02055 [Caldisphaera sp.]
MKERFQITELGDICAKWNKDSLNDIIDELGIPKNTFYSNWKRLRKKYRIYLIPNTINLNVKLAEYKYDKINKDHSYFNFVKSYRVKLSYIDYISDKNLFKDITNKNFNDNIEIYDIVGSYCFGKKTSSIMTFTKSRTTKLNEYEMSILSYLTKELMTTKELEYLLKLPWQRISSIIQSMKKKEVFYSIGISERYKEEGVFSVKLNIKKLLMPEEIRPFTVNTPILLKSLDDRLYVLFDTTLSKLTNLLNNLMDGSKNFYINGIYNSYDLPNLFSYKNKI